MNNKSKHKFSSIQAPKLKIGLEQNLSLKVEEYCKTELDNRYDILKVAKEVAIIGMATRRQTKTFGNHKAGTLQAPQPPSILTHHLGLNFSLAVAPVVALPSQTLTHLPQKENTQ